MTAPAASLPTTATDAVSASAPVAAPRAPTAPHALRMTDAHPDYLRLKAATLAKLQASVATLVRDLKAASRGQGTVPEAQHAFIARHTALLRDAYLAAHAAGQRHYWQQTSAQPQQWAKATAGASQPTQRQVQQRLVFYAAGSVTKLASQAAQALHAAQVTQRQGAQGSTLTEWVRGLVTLASGNSANGPSINDRPGHPSDALTDWELSIQGRLGLQSDITWTGLNDGYTAAGAVDPASKYATLIWALGPVKTEHCQGCVDYAAGSPYGPPGSGWRELDATPGDGHTECGAACHCVLSYGTNQALLQADAQAAWQTRLGRQLLPAPTGFPAAVPDQLDVLSMTPDQRALLGFSQFFGMTRAELVTAFQQQLDAYRAAMTAWDAAATAAGVTGATLGSLDAYLGQLEAAALAGESLDGMLAGLTTAQRAALDAGIWALIQADVTQQVGTFFGYGDLLDQTLAAGAASGQGGQLREPLPDDRVTLFNPNHDNLGRFATGGGAGGVREHESAVGGVHAPHGLAGAHGAERASVGGSGGSGHGHEAAGRATLTHEDVQGHARLEHNAKRPLADEHALAQAAGALPGGRAAVTKYGELKAEGVTAAGEHYTAKSVVHPLPPAEGGGHMLGLMVYRTSEHGDAAQYAPDVLREQVNGASALGIRQLSTKARSQSDDHAHLLALGFDCSIGQAMHESHLNPITYTNLHGHVRLEDKAPPPPRSFTEARSLADAYRHADARAWWDRWGFAPHMTFDNTRGSASRQRLEHTLQSLGLPGLEGGA